MVEKQPREQPNPGAAVVPPAQIRIGRALWGGAAMLAGLALLLVVARLDFGLAGKEAGVPTAIPLGQPNGGALSVPEFGMVTEVESIRRAVTIITARGSAVRYEVVTYTVEFGDSMFGIANQFDITPETLLWANEDLLRGRPDILAPGMVLNVPPTNGVYYQWQAGDTLESVARAYSVNTDAILEWPGNPIADLSNPEIPAGSWVMIPGGVGEFTQFVFPDLVSGSGQGVSNNVLGPGACSGPFAAGNGSGTFSWPSPLRTVVGNDYWDGHRALDIATGEGIGIYAADSGTVLFSGWANGGYGYMVFLDHGNGYSTLYAHLSQATAPCGRQVSKGEVIGYGGSTGNSTGPHLHFEVRFQGGFLNPWQVLPPP